MKKILIAIILPIVGCILLFTIITMYQSSQQRKMDAAKVQERLAQSIKDDQKKLEDDLDSLEFDHLRRIEIIKQEAAKTK
jgi:apolipoprotein N-acyltransferase